MTHPYGTETLVMDSFGEVAGWAETMLETIENGRMPPWHANPQHGSFLNAREMPDVDKQILRDWIAGGKKEGDPGDLPPAVLELLIEREVTLTIVTDDESTEQPAEAP